MHVHAATPERLEIRHRPVFWGVIFGCILFVLAGWALAGVLEGDWLGALIAAGLGILMGRIAFRKLLVSFTLVLDRGADRLRFSDSKGANVETALSRLVAVERATRLNSDNGRAQNALILKLDDGGAPGQIRLEAFRLRAEDVLNAQHALTSWLGTAHGGRTGGRGLDITVAVLTVAWLIFAACAVLVPYGVAVLFTGDAVRAAVLIVIGGGTSYALLERVLVRLDLHFDPDLGVIEMTRSNLLGKRTWVLPLEHFDGAELIERARFQRKGSINVDLLFRNTRPNMTIRLSALGLPEAEARKITADINRWLQDSDGETK